MHDEYMTEPFRNAAFLLCPTRLATVVRSLESFDFIRAVKRYKVGHASARQSRACMRTA